MPPRVGTKNHLPLEDLFAAVLAHGLRLERVEEPGSDDYPFLIGLAASK